MIIVAGTVRMQPGTRARFLEEVASMVAASLEEPGCRVYAFTPDPDDADLIRLYELWDHQEALDQHFASQHMADWKERAASLPITSRDIMCYTVTDARPLG
ncbi:MAG: putative quinol monooxygenase [bacterium]|nr:putative quinol monooxygenase [bacterium]MDE0601146.1 putative quinol monooxygenase [bacterium]